MEEQLDMEKMEEATKAAAMITDEKAAFAKAVVEARAEFRDFKPSAAADQVAMIPVSRIVSHGNMRTNFSREDLADLMISMKHQGLLQPIRVQPAEVPGKYDLIYGNRRWNAATKLGWKEIPAIVQSRGDSDSDLLVTHITENVQISALPVVDEGKGYQALIDQKLSPSEIAARCGVSEQRIQKALKIYNDVPSEYRDKVRNLAGRESGGRKGRIPSASAYEISQIARKNELDKEQIKKLYTLASEDQVTDRHFKVIRQLIDRKMEFDEAVDTGVDFHFSTIGLGLTKESARKIRSEFGTVAKAVVAILNQARPDLGFMALGRAGQASGFKK